MTDPLRQLAVHRPPETPRWRRALGGLVVAALGVGTVALVTSFDDLGPADPAAVQAPPVELAPVAARPTEPVAAAALEPAVEARPVLDQLGAAGGLVLAVPGQAPVVVSYHEASFDEALPISPAGTVVVNENATRSYDVLAGVDGPDHRIQVSRGRRPGPTTAVDVVLRDGEPVLSPVAGEVAAVRPYELYGVHEDVRLEVVPDDRPDLRVVLIHVTGVRVAAGDRVAVGDVLADGARRFPFGSVVDRATEPERHGHVHLEVKVPLEDPVDTAMADGPGAAVPDGG